MGGWYAPTAGVTAIGACVRPRRMKKNIAATAMEIAATPPTAPPTMAPTFELLLDAGAGAGRLVEEEPAALDKVVCDPADPPVAVEVAAVVAPEVPINLPGSISGESPTVID